MPIFNDKLRGSERVAIAHFSILYTDTDVKEATALANIKENTSTIIVRPLENYCGKCNVSTLRPWIGTDYMYIPECLEIIYDLNNWQLVTALDKVDDLIDRKPHLTLDLWRLKAEVYGLYDKYPELYQQCETILKQLPHDPQALFLAVYYGRIFDIPIEENPHYQTLKDHHPDLAQKLVDLVQFISDHSTRTDFEEDMEGVDQVDLICLFGYLVHEDGSLAPTTLKRASKALELARQFPQAEIMVSGGAVNSPYVEAVGIKNWLIQQGIHEDQIIIDPFAKDTVGNIQAFCDAIKQKDLDKVVIVSSMDHLPRCYMGVYTQLQTMKVDCDIYAAAYEKPYSQSISEDEGYREYQTLLRTAGCFTKNHFKAYQ